LTNQFVAAFGPIFDSAVPTVTDHIQEEPLTLGGIEFVITPTAEAFDIEIPEINAVYTHMLGHDCHSIVAGASHANAMIQRLETYLQKEHTLVLTSHYTPEDLKDVETKIAYLRELKVLASRCGDAAEFKAAVKERFPGYGGENYLEMTSGFFFA